MPETKTDDKQKPTETKRQAFERIAKRRTENALKAIALLGGLASPTNYDYTEDHWKAIFTALEAEMTKLQGRVKNPNAPQGSGFSFGG
jgi:hypothetical protein